MKSNFINWDLSRFIAEIDPVFTLLTKLKDTPQEPDWHGEGNVAIHTQMVLDQVYRLIEHEATHLTVSQQNILILSALFHDYGKPLTTKTREKEGVERIVAPFHEEAGSSLLFHMPAPLGLSNSEWLDVIRLVAYHDVPKKLVVQEKEKKDYVRFSRQVPSMELAYYLGRADMMGRVSVDRKEQLEGIELFRMFAEEHGVWNTNPLEEIKEQIKQRFPLIPEKTRDRIYHQAKFNYENGVIYMLEEEFARAYQYMHKQSHLVILCGASSSGKSSYIKQNYNDYCIISLDEIRNELFGYRFSQVNNDLVLRHAQEKLKQYLREGKDIVWDATNVRKDFREKIAQVGFNYNAFVELIVIQKNIASLIQDNKTREYPVIDTVIHKQIKEFQLPHEREAHNVTWISQP